MRDAIFILWIFYCIIRKVFHSRYYNDISCIMFTHDRKNNEDICKQIE